MPSTVRLYVSPFTHELLPAIIPAPVRNVATGISFHTIQTFPERNYGFVNLPIEMAEKLKKKLNGTTLKGSRMKVVEAKKEEHTNQQPEAIVSDEAESRRALRKSERKRKREGGVVQGIELPEDRKVKRGWTESAAQIRIRKAKATASGDESTRPTKAKTQPSKFTNKEECLFKTGAPASAAQGDTQTKKAKPKNGGSVVHEFKNTTKHASFLKDEPTADGHQRVEAFDEEQGWIGADGSVIEKSRRSRRKSKNAPPAVEQESSPPVARDGTGETTRNVEALKLSPNNEHGGSRSNRETPLSPPPTAKSPDALGTAPATEPHPLEAVFKKPAPPKDGTPRRPNLEVKVPFSFFGDDAGSEDAEAALSAGSSAKKKTRTGKLPNLSIPLTPFTQHDLSWRRQRSAAPTPDTAAPGKAGFGPLWGPRDENDDRSDGTQDEDVEQGVEGNEKEQSEESSDESGGNEEVDDEARESPSRGTGSSGKAGEQGEGKSESEFAKWFWEHRGENNRAWKRRRREAAKQDRQRENKRRTM